MWCDGQMCDAPGPHCRTAGPRLCAGRLGCTVAAQAQLWIHAGMRRVSGLGCACVHSLTGTTHALCSLVQCGCAPRVRRCTVHGMWCCAGLGWLAVWSRCLCACRDCEGRRLCDSNQSHTEATGLTAWAHQGAGWCWVHMHACGRVCKGMEGVMAHGMGWAVLGQACSLMHQDPAVGWCCEAWCWTAW